MKAIIVGSGNVATHIAFALKAAGITIVQIWSRNIQNSTVLANQVQTTAITDLSEIDKNADFCIISIKDDAISAIAQQLLGFKGVIMHTSGAVDLKIFDRGFKKYGVFYPLQTFSINKKLNFSTVPVCIEANTTETLNIIEKLTKKLSVNVFEVSSEKRKILHLAAVFACNFTNHLYYLSSELLTNNDLDFKMMRPLILETASKVQDAFPKDVQTGPAIRNDEQTLKKHEELLLTQPQLLNIYQILSESIKKTKK